MKTSSSKSKSNILIVKRLWRMPAAAFLSC